ncbi:MAG TPA: Gfo/Idh/MocA family oxidoreductase [Chitinophagaceae bacterium]|nr:Gfo/Idh/MocA family oxidoreductase [Chitinophagaceae bacterium]
MKIILLSILICATMLTTHAQNKNAPLRIGIAGLTHTHVHGILARKQKGDIQIVGIAEPNRELAKRYMEQYGLPMDLVYNSLQEMLDKTKPAAVFAFNSIYGHLEVVRICAPRGIHVMVEKPLAANLDHATQMQALAHKHKIQLLTNYETTWYPSNHKAYAMLHSDRSLGELRKLVVHDGHQGPKEIGVNKEFLNWLTDPVQNGGGAITDFGCYGANLTTWLMKGERPLSVMAVTQQIKPHIYPRVDDEATIIVTYPRAQSIIQASWNWPLSRKDMEVYGEHGYVIAVNGNTIRSRLNEREQEITQQLSPIAYPNDDPYGYFAAVIRGDISSPAYNLSSLENNMLVMEILDAAIRSAKSGKRVDLRGK